MKYPTLVSMTLLLVACGGPDTPQVAQASNEAGGEVDYCTCVNEPITSDARHKACSDMINALTPTENATKAMECRETLAVPEGGPDMCFCLRTTSRDPNVLQQCEDMIPEDWTPEDLTKKMVECMQ